MSSFAFAAPGSTAELLAAIQDGIARNGRSQVLAGGTDLLVHMRSQDPGPRAIIDMKKVPQAMTIEMGAKHLYIGACVPAATLTANEVLTTLFPGMMQAAGLIGSTQIQERASMGGNLCTASPAGDTIPAQIANAGICDIIGPEGRRETAVEDFVVGVQRNCLQPGECLLGLRFPRPGPDTADAYQRLIPRTEMDIAAVGAGASVTLDADGKCVAARVAIGAVAPTALLVPEAARALIGSSLQAEAVQEAARMAAAAARPITDKRGTAEYRRKVVAVLVKRVITAAADVIARRRT